MSDWGWADEGIDRDQERAEVRADDLAELTPYERGQQRQADAERAKRRRSRDAIAAARRGQGVRVRVDEHDER